MSLGYGSNVKIEEFITWNNLWQKPISFLTAPTILIVTTLFMVFCLLGYDGTIKTSKVTSTLKAKKKTFLWNNGWLPTRLNGNAFQNTTIFITHCHQNLKSLCWEMQCYLQILWSFLPRDKSGHTTSGTLSHCLLNQCCRLSNRQITYQQFPPVLERVTPFLDHTSSIVPICPLLVFS